MAVNGELASALDRLREVAMRNKGPYWEGEQARAKSEAQQVLESLSPALCVVCGERPRMNECIQLCEHCYRDVLPEIEAAERDGYKAAEEVQDVS